MVLGLKDAQRPAGQFDDFQGANDPAAVVGMEPGGGRRINGRQPAVGRGLAVLLGLSIQAESSAGGRRAPAQPAHQGLEIKSPAPDEQHPLAAPLDLATAAAPTRDTRRRSPIPRDRSRRAGGAGFAPLVEHRLGRADLHAR